MEYSTLLPKKYIVMGILSLRLAYYQEEEPKNIREEYEKEAAGRDRDLHDRERRIRELEEQREQKERDPDPDRGDILTLIKDHLNKSDKQTKLISTPIMETYLKPAETKKSGGIKMVQKTIVNQKARRKKAATKTRTSEYAALKKRVQARIRKERMSAYKGHGKRIAKLPVKERKAARKRIKDSLMLTQKTMFKTFVGKNKINIESLRKLLKQKIKWDL